MRCRIVRLLLPLYTGGDLSHHLQHWVGRHVDGCKSCADDLGKLHQVRRQVRALANRETPILPLDFAAQVRTKVAQGDLKTASFLQTKKWILAAAAVIVLAGVGVFNDWQIETSSETAVISDSVEVPAQAIEETEEDFTEGDLAAMMSRLHPNRALTDEELDRMYPVVASVSFPEGTQMVYHTDHPDTKIVWVFAREGAQVQ